MSYIAFDLDAFDAAESAARHAGASADAVMAGLLRLWRYCWRQKTDQVSSDQLKGIFGIDAGQALLAFGFVAPCANGYRVKGADRYLRVAKAQSEGGKKSIGNLKQFRDKPVEDVRLPSGSPPAPLRLEPEQNTGSFSEQRAATSEQRAANILGPAKKPRGPAKPVDPRYGPLVGRLKASYLELIGLAYAFSDADGGALKSLLPKGDDDDIDRRWRRGLTASQFETKCSTVLELLQRWNGLAIDRGAGPAGPPQQNLRVGKAEVAPGAICVVCDSPADAALADRLGCYPCISKWTAFVSATDEPKPWLLVDDWISQQRNQGAAA